MVKNEGLVDRTGQYGFVEKEFFRIEGNSGDQLNAFFLKPNDFSADKKYPITNLPIQRPGFTKT